MIKGYNMYKNTYTFLFFLLISCGHHEAKESPSMEKLSFKKSNYIAKTTPVMFQKRCDNLTFKSLFDAFGTNLDLFSMEKSGEWHRDESPCYPEESESECSRDGAIMLMHALLSRNDAGAVNRLIDYASSNSWAMCEGGNYATYTSLLPLVPTIYRLKNKLSSLKMNDSDDAIPAFSGFRGHLLALWLFLQARLKGELNNAEIELMESLESTPITEALKSKFITGDFNKILDTLLNEFPEDPINEVGVYGWGSAPQSVYFITAASILEFRP